MRLFKIIKNILNHPFNRKNKIGALKRFFKWQINCRINPYPIVYPFTENSKLLMWKSLTGATGNLYNGLMEYEDMGFLLHFLRPNDLFVDIGANVGVYTILASAEIKAKSISIEPIPTTYNNLIENLYINKINDRVEALNLGVSNKEEKLYFTTKLDSTNHVLKLNDKDTIEVEVSSLDFIIKERTPALIKIDVEGFEKEVLDGAINTLKNNNLKAIIIELNGLGIRYGYTDEEIHCKLSEYGFSPFQYDPESKVLYKLETYNNGNTIYIRDESYVHDRIKNSKKINIGSSNYKI